MAIEIGSKGLAEVNLTIPQGASLSFTIEHEDENDHEVDHTNADVSMAFQSKDGKTSYDLSSHCEGTTSGVSVFIPASATAVLPTGKLVWDLFSSLPSGESFRLAYGTVTVVDTYALDGE